MLASRRMKRLAVAAALGVLSSMPALPAEPCQPASTLVVTGIGTWSDEYARLLDLAPGALAPQSGILRRGGVTERTICEGAGELLWGTRYVTGTEPARLEVVPPHLTLAYQSLGPGGSNDGMLWQGRDFSTLAGGGVRGAWGPFSAQLAPEVTWSQNADFRIRDTGRPGRLQYANAFYGDQLDVPQRFGGGAFARAGFGQSFVAVQEFGARLALSTENLWWGPGIRNALLLSNNAEGFPHVSLGTSHPIDIWVGTVEAELVWGRLEKSRYFYTRAHPVFNGLALSFQPRWIRGLYLGAGRTFVEDLASLRRSSYLSVLEGLTKKEAGGDNPTDNQVMSAWFRWVMPEIELYGELGQDDFPKSLASFWRGGDRAGAWVLGFQKRWVAGRRWWRIVGELAKTRSNLPPGYATSFYVHTNNADYTNAGQLLGDWIGPGADTQYLAIDAFVPSGRIGGYFERVRRNEEIFWSQFAGSSKTDHDVELVVGLRQVLLTRHLELGWDVAAGHRWNRDFLKRYQPTLRAMVTVAMPLGGGAGSARPPPESAEDAPGHTAP